ncbi:MULTISPECIES: TRAP transporter fused permease subunit [unclassified Paenibacillus]|uniref:TRAP transporter permease n=1 Tax=unclassified Paenibacillus TaxID=185978 RepID=UPI001AE43057|nr:MULTISPECIES: TRAP transporter fused permease subunit [unclassified Paenibacillus]MBP1154060.1 TRAP transporter 4TM/12TM fusion protein [Paenibacillus sp. PvP091]MBP1170555.1 TRAP transporter 4TM/12TM fusion protein [Paenibacillus sp. PvR098]MBP2441583.1 TRAP transporter 4TM/12TM fusion protein [Paenibacillus sp. PvP052]
MHFAFNLLKVLFFFFREGNRVHPPKWAYRLIVLLSVSITLFALWLGFKGTLHPLEIGMIFLPVMYFIAYLTTTSYYKLSRLIWTDYLCAFLSLACGIYFYFNIERFTGWMVGLSRFIIWDKVFSALFVLLTLELMRRAIGIGLSMVVYALLAYIFFGHHIQGAFSVHKVDLDRFFQIMTIGNDGIFGQSTLVAVTYAFLFVLFGILFQVSGGGKFFFDIAASMTGRRVGGPAKVALVSSGLFGMVSGSPVSDVMTTGSATIPAMKKIGYSPSYAAAIEAAASCGGSILPPIMGATVFLMAGFTGIPYSEIATSAIFVALLYYFALYMQVHYLSISQGIGRLKDEEMTSVSKALIEGWANILPFAVLIWMIFTGYTPSYAATMSVFAVIMTSWFKQHTRITLKKLFDAFVSTCMTVAPLVAAVAAAGIVEGALLLTGLSGKVASLVNAFAGGNLVLAALLTMIITIILGMGMPTISVYVLSAGLLAPVLIDLGVNPLSAHLFLVYYATMSAISPPVAVASFAAAAIANAHPMDVANKSVKMAFVAFILPFFFLFEPALLLQGDTPTIITRMALAVLGIYLLVVSFGGWINRKLSTSLRALSGLTGLMLIVPNWWVTVVALLLSAVFWFWYKKGNNSKLVGEMSA